MSEYPEHDKLAKVKDQMRDGYVRFDVTRTDKWKKAQNLPGREVQSTVFFE